MEISDVRRKLRDAVAEAKRNAADRRSRHDEASRAWADALERIVLPVCRQVVNVLKAEAHPVQIFTPADHVRIGFESRPQDFVELVLQADGSEAIVLGRISQSRGRETITEERAFVRGGAAIAAMTEEQVLDFVSNALAGILVR